MDSKKEKEKLEQILLLETI